MGTRLKTIPKANKTTYRQCFFPTKHIFKRGSVGKKLLDTTYKTIAQNITSLKTLKPICEKSSTVIL